MVKSYKECAPVIVRFAVCFVFLWFGINQLANPGSFLGYVPAWFFSGGPLHFSNLSPEFLISMNGLLETVFGALLLLGIFTRLSAFALAVHIFVIALGLGYNDVAIRDVGISIATFSVFVNGPDKFCLDNRFREKLPSLLRKFV